MTNRKTTHTRSAQKTTGKERESKKKRRVYRCGALELHDGEPGKCRRTVPKKGGVCNFHQEIVDEPDQPAWAEKAVAELGQYIDVRSETRPDIVHHVYTGDSAQAPHCTCEAFHHGTREYNILFTCKHIRLIVFGEGAS